ncbi:MAG TPA: DUF3996 domain-containing protein [Kofleriaceae bacterium]|jgi:hypothetical protein
MKTSALIVLVTVLGVSGTVDANRRRHFVGTSDYQSNGTFGLGLELIEPTGLTGKLFLTPSTAIDFGVGDLYHNYYVPGDGVHIYVDYLWHPFLITEVPAFKLPFYIGVGGRVWFGDYNCGGPNDCGADFFGVRVPIGVTFDFNEVPLDTFIQVVPTLDFYHDYAGRDVYFDVDFSIGIRYWFS